MARLTTSRVARSPCYASDPVGPVPEQPRFANAALAIDFERPVDPVEMLRRLQDLERALGRRRPAVAVGGPRTIDLDLLLLGDRAVDAAGPPPVTLPHPRMHQRCFVLRPLCDLAGADLMVPGCGSVGSLLAAAGGALEPI